MKTCVRFFGVFVIVSGLILLWNPGRVIFYLKNHSDEFWMYFSAVGVRFVVGVLLYFSARYSVFPRIFKFIGTLFVFIALAYWVAGYNKFRQVVNLFSDHGQITVPVLGVTAVVFGSFILFAVRKKH